MQNHTLYAPPWLVGRSYDLAFFQLPILIGLLWFIPYYFYGLKSIFYIYVAQSLLVGMPHLYMTCFSLLHPEAQKNIRMTFVYATIAVALFATAIIVIYLGEWISNLLISMAFFLGGWHSHRQHFGILKLYTFLQSQRWKDSALISEMAPLNWFHFFAMNTLFVFSFTRPEISYQITYQHTLSLIYPHLPIETLYIYITAVATLGIWAFYRIVYLRHFINKKPLPWPQISLALLTISVASAMYLTLPPKAYMLLWIIPGFAHNMQYIGYVWLFERKRVMHIENSQSLPSQKLSFLLELVKKNNWKTYFGLIYGLTIFSIFIGLIGYELAALTLVHFLTIFHYIGDGFFWKKDINAHVKPVSNLILSYHPDSTRSSN